MPLTSRPVYHYGKGGTTPKKKESSIFLIFLFFIFLSITKLLLVGIIMVSNGGLVGKSRAQTIMVGKSKNSHVVGRSGDR